jgi:hypothetical protein
VQKIFENGIRQEGGYQIRSSGEGTIQGKIRGVRFQGKWAVEIGMRSCWGGDDKLLESFEGFFGFWSPREIFGSFGKVGKRERMLGIKSYGISIIISKAEE